MGIRTERLRYEYKELGTGDPIESENLVEFRLLYSGRLMGATNTKTRADLKHEIRRQFHPQLRRLWQTNHGLQQLASYAISDLWRAQHPDADLRTFSDEDRRQAGIESIAMQWQRAGFSFVPLVTSPLALRCRIEILFLRPDEPRYVMESGDLDNRIKTLFDALRIPKNLDETSGMGPQADEAPFFCLLEDDKLISEVSINADQLLLLPNQQQINPNEAFLVIRVELNHAHAGTFDRYF